MYGDSEEMLGAIGSGKIFIISTKVPSGWEVVSASKKISSMTLRLKMDKFDTGYIHGPDLNTPLAETYGGINKIYKAGHFARFGLSNYLPDEVEAVYEHCKATVTSYLACIKGRDLVRKSVDERSLGNGSE